MKKLQLFLLFVTLVSKIFAQTTVSTVYKSTTGNNKFITFDGHQKHRAEGEVPARMSVMESRVDDVYLSMREPVYAASYKPKPTEMTGKWTPKTPIILGRICAIKNNQYPPAYTVPSLSKSYTGYMMSGENGAVEVIAMGINESNLRDYRFRVIENDSTELIPWTVPTLAQMHGAKHAYGYLGKYYSPDKEITIEVVNIKNYSIRDGMVLNWRNHLKPVISKIIGYKKGKGTNAINLGHRQRLILDADTLESVNISFNDHQTLPYDIYWVIQHTRDLAPHDTVLIQSGLKDNFYSLSNQYFASRGLYKLLIYPVGTKDENRKKSLAFDVEGPDDYKRYTAFQIFPYVFLFILAFVIYSFYNRRRIKRLAQQKEKATLKLAAVRAQLNPHFMFNALTSIQNLMHQQNIAGASHYLTKFADLTRQVLNATSKELISLEDELRMIEDYLQVEQLRFGFTYKIDVDTTINIANTEVPAMLIQPFIENAAKHGVSSKLNEGEISITVSKQINNLLFIVTDNGKGFDEGTNFANGYGLIIGRERIALLNQIYKGQPMKLKIDSIDSGTKVTIVLTDWLN